MGLFSSKKGAIPEIASNASMDTMPSSATQEFPSSSMSTQIERPKDLPSANSGPQLSAKAPTTQLPTTPQLTQMQSLPQPQMQPTPSITAELSMDSNPKPDQPFFVRIDKFSETVENFRKVYDQVHQIEKIVESLELTKEEEEREIEEWKKDIVDMKNNLNKIDKEIFSKI